MDSLLALGPTGAAGMIVFVVIAVLKAQLPLTWWSDSGEGVVTLFLSVAVVEGLLLYSGWPTISLKEYLQAAVAGAVVSLAVRYGHGKLEDMLEARVRKQIEAEGAKK